MNRRAVIKTIAAQIVANINAAIFLIGVFVLYVGIAEYSHALANIVLGVLMIVTATWPYLYAMKKARG